MNTRRYINTAIMIFVVAWGETRGNVCQPPDVPTYGSYSPVRKMYDTGDKVVYFCDSGYLRVGNEMRSCKVDGKWTGVPPFCDSPVKLKNAIGSSASSMASFSLDRDTTTCFRSQSGTGENYKVHLDRSGQIHFIRIFLPRGQVKYELSLISNGQLKHLCILNRNLEEGQWVSVVNNLIAESNAIFIQDISDSRGVIIICEVEAYVKGSVWCEKPPQILIPNGRLQIGRDRSTLECNEGFEPGDYKRIVCDKEQWTGGILQCKEILCKRNIANTTGGDWLLLGKNNKYSVGSQKRLKCDFGHKLSGSPEMIECLPNGLWTSTTAICEKQNPPRSDSYYHSIVVGAVSILALIVIAGFVLVLVILIRKKPKPVVVVVKEDAESTEYTTISYDSLNVSPQYPTLPPPRPPVDLIVQYSTPKDPPPYMSPLYIEPEPVDSRSATTLKLSPLYGEA